MGKMKRLLIAVTLALFCCALSGCGSMYAVHYSASSEEARSALAKKFAEEPALQGLIFQSGSSVQGPLGSYRRPDRLILTCPAKTKDTPEFRVKRKAVEDALGPELMKLLRVFAEFYPNA